MEKVSYQRKVGGSNLVMKECQLLIGPWKMNRERGKNCGVGKGTRERLKRKRMREMLTGYKTEWGYVNEEDKACVTGRQRVSE